jgi:hypothetical protein
MAADIGRDCRDIAAPVGEQLAELLTLDMSSPGWKIGTPFCVTITPPGVMQRLQAA